MDFEIAAQRLRKDQQSALARSRASRSARNASARAKREAAQARQRAERRLREKRAEGERSARTADGIVRAVGRAERGLGVADVAPSPASRSGAQQEAPVASENKPPGLFARSPLARGWTFAATSIHGEGDKIALPPSVLEEMTNSNNDLDPWGGGRGGRPVAFRIGVPNPDYAFPSGEKMKALVESVRQGVISSEKNELARQSSTASNEDVDDEEPDDSRITEAYLDELSHRYLSYTHGTVVEFTQENDCVGLPEPIARALLRPNSHSLVGSALAERDNAIPARRTVDPASPAAADHGSSGGSDEKIEKDEMDIDAPNGENAAGEADTGEKTPGHPAYGLFDVPALPVEVIPVNALPPGTDCTFTPTASSIRNGFYALRDVKSVLEQSLMRTRATLSRGDAIRTWRRGVPFDLIVSSLSPAGYGAVSCINTNLNVDIGPPEGGEAEASDEKKADDDDAPARTATNTTGGGRLLSEPSAPTTAKNSAPSPDAAADAAADAAPVALPPEPAADVKEGVCNVQIRGRAVSGGIASGRRRFDVAAATVSDLFAFASQVCDGMAPSAFRLVTRFPRRVFRIADGGGEGFAADATLESAGIGQGQEMFMVETV